MADAIPAGRPLRVAIVGTGARAAYMYGRLLPVLSDQVELVAVWGRSEGSARKLGESLSMPWYTDLDRLVRETEPEIGIVCVGGGANGEVGLRAVEAGLHVLLETPIAGDLGAADAIIATAARNGTRIEVSEQFHRRPLEQIKLRLIASGLFGTVHSSFNDFAGHGYHGVSVMRSYLGFDAVPERVTGAVREYPLAPQWSRIHGTSGPRTETQEHGIVEFADGRLGIYHWTDVGYDSPLRWWRSSRFLAEKGMGITVGVGLDVTEQLTLLAPGGEGPRFITLERRWERVDGGVSGGDGGPHRRPRSADCALGQPLRGRLALALGPVARRRDRRRRLSGQPCRGRSQRLRPLLRPVAGKARPGDRPGHPQVVGGRRASRDPAA